MAAEPSALRTLGTITWGERLGIARARAGLSYKELATRVGRFMGVHPTTLMRLEQAEEAPDEPRRRQLATLILLLCDYDPEDFGLSEDELPRRWLDWLSDQGTSASPWTTALPDARLLRSAVCA